MTLPELGARHPSSSLRPRSGGFLRENGSHDRYHAPSCSTRSAPWSSWSRPGCTWRRRSASQPDERLVGAVRAEMDYYRDHSHEGRDAGSLAELRARCAAVLSRGAGPRGLGRDDDVRDPLPGLSRRGAGAGRAARARAEAGLRLELGRLPARGARALRARRARSTGSSPRPRRVSRKPDPAIFAPALELAGCAAAEALYVGDTPAEDLAAARAAGIPALLIDRAGGGGHRLAGGHPAPSRPVSDSVLAAAAVEPRTRGRRRCLERPRPAISPGAWGPAARSPAGIGALLLTTVFEVGVVSAFDPDLDSLAARLVTQALLAGDPGGHRLRRRRRQRRRDRLPPGARPRGAPCGLRSALAAAAYLGYIVIALVYSALVHPHQEDVTRDLGFGHGAFGTIAAGVLIVVAAPFSEEIFFRGFIFGGLRRRLSFPVAAVLSAAIFGLFHFTGPGSIAVVPAARLPRLRPRLALRGDRLDLPAHRRPRRQQRARLRDPDLVMRPAQPRAPPRTARPGSGDQAFSPARRHGTMPAVTSPALHRSPRVARAGGCAGDRDRPPGRLAREPPGRPSRSLPTARAKPAHLSVHVHGVHHGKVKVGKRVRAVGYLRPFVRRPARAGEAASQRPRDPEAEPEGQARCAARTRGATGSARRP